MKVLISTTSFGRHAPHPLEILKSAGCEVILNPYGRKLESDEVIELANGCVGIIAGTERYDDRIFKRLPMLKVLSRCGAGIDSVDISSAERHNILVKNTPDAPTDAVAELTVGFILNISRQLNKMDRDLREGQWNKIMGQLLSGKTVGIIGLGRIGRRVASLLKNFKVDLIAYDVEPNVAYLKKSGIKSVSLKELFQKSDIITIHVPYTEKAYHMVNSETLKSMKKGAILINTSRGGIVDEEALYRYLKNGLLGGAAIDTFENEPYHGPLRELDNVILTPHIGSYAKEARINMEIEAVENMINALRERDNR